MGIYHQIDEASRRVIMTPDETLNGRQVARRIVEMVTLRPELADWDWIHDLRNASGEASNEDVAAVARAFTERATPGGRSFTVFVTEDPVFPLWARTMDPQFNGRAHLTAPTLEAAQSLLDRRRNAA